MKLSKIFHFLYFSVLAIPLVTVPIFAIYSQNHEINDNTLTINESYYENNVLYDSNEVNTINDLQVDKIYHYDTWGLSPQDINDGFEIRIYHYEKIDYDFDSQYTDETNTLDEYVNNENNYLLLSVSSGELYFIFTNGASYTTIGFVDWQNCYFIDLDFVIVDYSLNEFKDTLQNAHSPLPTFSDYKVIETIYHENDPVTYNDTDIMSQFMYQEYNFMDKYLGMYKYQPFASIYSWLANTFFGGSAPLVFTIFYQWFAYWLFVSLCWLVFDVLIYVPMVAHRWLDKGALE